MNARVPFWSTECFEFEKVIALLLQNNIMHSPVTTGISFALIIGAVGGAFAYVSGSPIEIIPDPWFGFSGSPLTPALAEAAGLQGEGFLVMFVEEGSPADIAGLRDGDRTAVVEGEQVRLGGDLITAINGTPVTGAEQIRNVLETSRVGDTVNLTILRGNDRLNIEVVLEEFPG
jgi:S1-C subfamily serine protease